jgi:raffinose synthase
MYKVLFFYYKVWYIVLPIVLFGCKTKHAPMNPNVRMHFNKLTISWEGKDRISGMIPHLEKTNIKFHEVHTSRKDTSEICEFVHNFKDHVEIRASVSEKNGTVSFFLSPNNFHTQKASDFVGVFFDSIPGFVSGNAFHKYGPVGAWAHPDIVDSPHKIQDKDNQFFIWKYEDGMYGACLPLIGKGYVSSIGKYKNNIGVMAYHSLDGHNENDIPVLTVAFGKTVSEVVSKIYEESLGKNRELDSLQQVKEISILTKKLGWCSWNAFGHEVSHDKLIEAAKSFKENSLPVKWILIDDGWQTVTGKNGKLSSFEPDYSKFPFGLASTIKELKQNYGIEKVGVWHTLNGYWSGIEPESELGARYRTELHGYNDKVTWTEVPTSVFFLPKPEGGEVFYSDWYSYLKNEGVDFVKVDNQLINQKIAQGSLSFDEAAKQIQANFQKPAKEIFQESVLNCMCVTNDVLFHLTDNAIARSSEDYFPENNSFNLRAGNEAVHVYNNIQNNTWISKLAITDFDMFQSHRLNGHYHALARVLNNGPVYITDFPWQHNSELIQSLCLGNGEILKAESPLLPTDNCLFESIENGIFTAKSYFNNVILLGAWNTTSSSQQKQFEWKEADSKQYIVYDWNLQSKTILENNSKIEISLDALACKHYLIFEHKDFVAIGLKNKLISPATIQFVKQENKGVNVILKEPGEFVAYSVKQIKSVNTESGDNLDFEWNDQLLKVDTDFQQIKINFI